MRSPILSACYSSPRPRGGVIPKNVSSLRKRSRLILADVHGIALTIPCKSRKFQRRTQVPRRHLAGQQKRRKPWTEHERLNQNTTLFCCQSLKSTRAARSNAHSFLAESTGPPPPPPSSLSPSSSPPAPPSRHTGHPSAALVGTDDRLTHVGMQHTNPAPTGL